MSQSSNDPTNGRSGIDRLTESEYHRILSSERRRTLLDVLTDRSTPIGVEEVAAAITEREGSAETAQGEATRRVALTLYHVHVPLLAHLGVIEYDATSHRIESFHGRLSV